MLINTNSSQSNQILFNSGGNNFSYSQAFLTNISSTFEYSPSYFQVTKTLNGIDSPILYDTWIMDQESYKEASSKKKIIMKPTQDLDRGDIINWNSQKWLCTNVDMQVFPYNEGVLEYCNDTLKCILPNGKMLNEPCILTQISKKSMTIEKDGTAMESQKMPFFVTCQNNQNSIKIMPSYRFIFGQKTAYKVTDIDDVSMKGTLIMILTSNQNRPTDDFINQLADNGSLLIPNPVGALIISGSAKIATGASQPYQILYDNGTSPIGISYTFTVSSLTNSALTIVDGLNCTIKGVNSSQVKLTATNNVDGTVLFKILSIASSW